MFAGKILEILELETADAPHSGKFLSFSALRVQTRRALVLPSGWGEVRNAGWRGQDLPGWFVLSSNDAVNDPQVTFDQFNILLRSHWHQNVTFKKQNKTARSDVRAHTKIRDLWTHTLRLLYAHTRECISLYLMHEHMPSAHLTPHPTPY